MYDDLVKSLRQCAEASCAGCKNDLVQIGCRGLLQHEAADAIEELSRRVEDYETRLELTPEAQYAIDKHATDLIGQMDKLIECLDEKPRWISIEERLPNEGEYVLIWVGNVQVAEIRKGISKKERALMKSDLIPDRIVEGWSLSDGFRQYKRSESYKGYDENGNNLVPYRWYANGGPMSWFGQDVTHWMPLPEPPKEET